MEKIYSLVELTNKEFAITASNGETNELSFLHLTTFKWHKRILNNIQDEYCSADLAKVTDYFKALQRRVKLSEQPFKVARILEMVHSND